MQMATSRLVAACRRRCNTRSMAHSCRSRWNMPGWKPGRSVGTVAIAAGLAMTFDFGERVRMRFESTFTNLPNHLNYAPPTTDVTSPSKFGKLRSVQTAENGGNRTGQVALRLEF